MCKISPKNSKWLLRKWQITLGDTFFAAHCRCLLVIMSLYCTVTEILSLVYDLEWPWTGLHFKDNSRNRGSLIILCVTLCCHVLTYCRHEIKPFTRIWRHGESLQCSVGVAGQKIAMGRCSLRQCHYYCYTRKWDLDSSSHACQQIVRNFYFIASPTKVTKYLLCCSCYRNVVDPVGAE